MRVAFVSNYPVPYQRELLDALAREGRMELRPFFLAARDPQRAWPAERQIANMRVPPSIALPGAPEELRWHPSLPAEVLLARADITIVCGYSHLGFQATLAALSGARRPFVVWSELPRIAHGSAAVRTARRALMLPLRRARALLAIGTRAAHAWKSLLPSTVPVANFPYVCAIDRYLALERPHREPGTFTFLFCGQLIERKGVDLLMQAFARVAPAEPGLRLRLAGDGPLRSALEEMLPAELRSRVEFLGSLPWEKLPQTYAAADALVIPSRHDGWALVVNEALAAGIPVIASDAVGAAVDLVRPDTGCIVRAGDVGSLAAALRQLPLTAESMSPAARSLGMQLTPQAAAVRLHELLECAVHCTMRDSLDRWP